MKRTNKRRTWRLLLFLAMSSYAFSIGCAAKAPSECVRHAPRPNVIESLDYRKIVLADPERPAVAYFGRLLGWAFPDVAAAARARSGG